ncbi:MAG: EF-P beta-lysylation protein EpmB [Planctomycetaceae bacterium]
MPDAALPEPPGSRAREMAGPRWRRELAAAFRDPESLLRFLGLPAAAVGAGHHGFPLLVPRAFAARMRKGDPRDPLLLQVLPQAAESRDVPGFTADPVHESAALAAPGLVRKYAGRALVLVTGGCAVHCRYCFRREFPYADAGATLAGVEAALDAVAADASVSEAILSGGDPLLVDDARLGAIVARLEAVPHVRRLRIHTRLPVVLPSRVTDGLAGLLAGSRLSVVVVVHANHAAEIDADVAAALGRLAASRCLLLNQAVLLAGVNDSVAALRELSERLVDVGVLPYYLHLLDRVRGAAHFEVSEPRAEELHRALRDSLPGYAVPRLVREEPGAPAKTWVA